MGSEYSQLLGLVALLAGLTIIAVAVIAVVKPSVLPRIALLVENVVIAILSAWRGREAALGKPERKSKDISTGQEETD